MTARMLMIAAALALAPVASPAHSLEPSAALSSTPDSVWATSTPAPPLAFVQDASPEPRRFNGWTGPRPRVSRRCRHPDGYAQVGETRCVKRGCEQVLAECTVVLNNTSWRVTGESCAPPLT